MVEGLTIALYADLNHTYGRKILAGLAAYARTRRNWWIEPLWAKVQESDRALAETGAAGIILAGQNQHITEIAAKTGKPTVNISGRLEHSPFPRVTVNNLQIGEMAARHLMDLGVESYAYLPNPESPGHNFRQRQRGFINTLNKEDFSVFVYGEGIWIKGQLHSHRQPGLLRGWLQSLPRQTGLLADSDDQAARAVTICRQAGIDVPNELLVMGVDHDELQSIAAGTLLTSIDVNATTIGYEAAKLLERMLNGEQIAMHAEVEVPPVGVVTGASTDFVACGDEHIAKVLTFIRDNATRTLSVEELTDLVPLSRRAMELRFQRVIGRSPGAEIRRIRIERVKDLLAHTDLPIGVVALDMGFGDVKNLSTAFRKETGLTPTEFRRRCQPLAHEIHTALPTA